MDEIIIAPEILVITDRTTKALYDAVKNPHILLLRPTKISFLMDNNGIKILYNGKLLDTSKVKYCYFPGCKISSQRNLIQVFESTGAFCFPSSESIALTASKWRQYTYYIKHNLPIIPTFTGNIHENGIEYINKFLGSDKFVSKPDCGSCGKNATEINDITEINDELKNNFLNHRYVLQKYVDPNVDERYDIRIIVYDNRVVCTEKRFAVKDFRTNLSVGNPGEAYTPTKEEADLAIATVNAIPGLHIAGVDLIYDGDELKVIEANVYPGDKICSISKVNFYKYVTDDLLSKIQPNTSSNEVSSE